MPRKTTHPEGLQEVNALEITDEIRNFVSNLSKDVETERGNRQRWDYNQDRWHNLRHGIRTTPKTSPWENAANYSIPVIDSKITELKPSYASLIKASPICTFDPYGGEDIAPARKREQLFDWRVRKKMNFVPQYLIGIDKCLQRGGVVFKTVWDYSTRNYTEEFDLDDYDQKTIEALTDPRTTDDMLLRIILEEFSVDDSFEENIEECEKAVGKFREGKTKFDLKLIEIENNKADVVACDLKDDLVIPWDTTDLQWARFIANPFSRTFTQIKLAMRDEKYQKYTDNEIAAWGTKEKKGVPSGEEVDEIIDLSETCCWYDVNDDGIKERCIATYPVNTPQDVLRFIEVPYDHGLFPYADVRRELIDMHLYASRGIPQLEEDYQIGISTAINQAEDNGTITNKPVVVMRRNTVTNIKSRRYIPGETVETQGSPDDYQIRQMGNISQPLLFQFAQYLKSWSDNRVKSISAKQSMDMNLPGMGRGGKKTKAEIVDTAQDLGLNEEFDLAVFQVQMAKVYYQIDALYEQYGDEEEEMLMTGRKPVKVKRREIQGKWNIVPNGRLDNTNPVLRATKSWNLLRTFTGDPDVKQAELKRMFLDDYDPKAGQRLLYTDKEKKMIGEYQKKLMNDMKEAAVAEGIELKQIDTFLDLYKEEIIARIHGRKYAPDEKEAKKEESD